MTESTLPIIFQDQAPLLYTLGGCCYVSTKLFLSALVPLVHGTFLMLR